MVFIAGHFVGGVCEFLQEQKRLDVFAFSIIDLFQVKGLVNILTGEEKIAVVKFHF